MKATVKIASTGSKYYRINGKTFRISDHEQPSHYQMKNYYDVENESKIEEIVNNPLFSFYANPSKEADGRFCNNSFDEKSGDLIVEYITENEYNLFVAKMEEKRQFMLQNGWKGDILF